MDFFPLLFFFTSTFFATQRAAIITDRYYCGYYYYYYCYCYYYYCKTHKSIPYIMHTLYFKECAWYRGSICVTWYLLQISMMENENGKTNYKSLYLPMKCLLVISQGDWEAEHGFYINKHDQYSWRKHRRVYAWINRFVKDYLIKVGGFLNAPITKKKRQNHVRILIKP